MMIKSETKVSVDKFKVDKVYGYSEAIELAGNGRYTIGLVVILSLTLLTMCLDLFSFSMVVNFCSCEFMLTIQQKSILVSIPFIGSVTMAYFWGYASDTKGRRRSLIVAMSVGWVMSALSAFSPNWIVMAVLKLIGTCFSSGAQSASYTLLGESCAERVKGKYLLFMTSIIHINGGMYFAIGYFINKLDFSYDLGIITFTPWRLLVLILSLPLGICALSLLFFYESPKFLLNVGREDDAIEVLRKISEINGGNADDFPIRKLILNEEGNALKKDIPLLQSLREQTLPLFKPPYLWNTLLLYYLLFTIYSSNTALYIWMPFFAKAFAGYHEDDVQLCTLITNATKRHDSTSCQPSIEPPMIYLLLSFGLVMTFLNVALSKVATRRKAIMISILSVASACCLGTNLFSHKVSSYLYFGILIHSMSMGPIFSYYVDLYPTSYRGMASCLGVMMTRVSSIIGVNLLGTYIMSDCTITFYSMAALIFSGALISCLLPSDRPKKIKLPICDDNVTSQKP